MSLIRMHKTFKNLNQWNLFSPIPSKLIIQVKIRDLTDK